MRVANRQSTVYTVLAASLLSCFCLPPAAWADVLDSAKMLPGDTAIMISVESVADLQTALEKTSLHELYKDPAIQQLVSGAEKKIRARIDNALKDFWHKMKVENPPAQIPYPEGRLVLHYS